MSFAHCQKYQPRQLVGGFCEGCEAVFEFGNRKLTAVDTLIDFDQPGPQMKLTGTVYESDGKTPAKDVVLYVYHTNQKGIYPKRGDESRWARRHGYIRGWIKTGSDGKYTFFTLKPGTYPTRSQASHVHVTVLEPNGKYYWIESFYFAGDPLLSKKDRQLSNARGGSGVVQLKEKDGLLTGKRDIILGKNIPDYD